MKPLFSSVLISVALMLITAQGAFGQFSGAFDHTNWQPSPSDGTIDALENQLMLIGAEGSDGSIEYTITVNSDLLINFDWQFNTTDEGANYDPGYYTINGNQYQFTDDQGALSQMGNAVVFVPQGAAFGFRQHSDGCCGVGTLVITNFTYEASDAPGGGASCDQALPVMENEINITTGSQSGIWHSFIMPNDEGKKLVFDVPAGGNAQVYHGSCNDMEFVDSFFGSAAVISTVPPGDNIFIEFFSEDPAFGWTLSVLDVTPGEFCENAIVANTGENNVVVNDGLSEVWYSYLVPESPQKLLISSEAFEVVQIYKGGCSSLSYEAGAFSNVEITALEPGEPFYIKWSTNFSDQDFIWAISEVAFEAGDLCSSALQAVDGENAAESDGGDKWFTFRMPDEPGKKLVITSSISGDLDVYVGSCSNLDAQHSGVVDVTLTSLFPGQQVYIRWRTDYPDQLLWNLVVEDLQPGEGCLTALEIDVNVNSGDVLIQAGLEQAWYRVSIPANKKLIVSSPTTKYVENFVGPCENNTLQIVDGPGGFESPNFVGGQTALIRWFPTGETFTFNVSFAELLPGEGCSTAPVADVGPNLLVSDGLISTYIYGFTMPLGSPKKLKLTSAENNYVNFYHGPCGSMEFAEEGFGNIEHSGFSPGETVFINWSVSPGDNFSWQLVLEDIGPGDDCTLAIEAVEGINNTSLAPQWFTFTMPNTGDITISSLGFTNSDTYLKIYDGCSGNQLAESDDFDNVQSQVTLDNVEAGTILKIKWDDDYDNVGFDWSIALLSVSQTITFDAISERSILDSPFDLIATATSNLPVILTSQNENVATIDGSTITIVGIGSTDITASQPGNQSFNAAAPVVRMLTVVKAAQSITFEIIPNKTIEDVDFSINASSTSDLAVTFESADAAVATVNGNTITIVGVGSTEITASQPGNEIYTAAVPVMRTLVVKKLSQSITFESISDKMVDDPDFELIVSSSSGLPVTLVSSNQAVATISDNVVNIVGPGSTTITATQTGNNTYGAATAVQQQFSVTANQSITFASLAEKTFGDAPFQLSATASSGLEVIFESSDPSIASVAGNKLTILHAGLVDITAYQAGNESYAASAPVMRSLIIFKKAQEINFTTISAKTLGDVAFQLNASTNSLLDVNYLSSDPTIAGIMGNTITLLAAGSVMITASQDGNNDFLAAAPVEQTFCVNPPRPSITASFADTGAPLLTSSAATDNQWYHNEDAIGGATGVNYTVTSGGQFTVLTKTGECSSDFSEAFSVLITDIHSGNEIALYPNPVDDYLLIQGIDEHAIIEMVSASGVRHNAYSEWIASEGNMRVMVSSLSSGVYTLLIQQKNRVSRLRFFKK
jgi:hypothetical protein